MHKEAVSVARITEMMVLEVDLIGKEGGGEGRWSGVKEVKEARWEQAPFDSF